MKMRGRAEIMGIILQDIIIRDFGYLFDEFAFGKQKAKHFWYILGKFD